MNETAAIEEILDRLVQAWNRRDGPAFAALFTSDADYVTGDGDWIRGRGAIDRLVRDAAAGAEAFIEGAVSIRQAGNVATAVFRWSARVPDGAGSRGVTTCVLTRRQSRWLIELLQNTDCTAP